MNSHNFGSYVICGSKKILLNFNSSEEIAFPIFEIQQVSFTSIY